MGFIRKHLSHFLFFLLLPLFSLLLPLLRYKILSREKTIEYIILNKCSAIRFGDGEISIILGGHGPNFQPSSQTLRQRLIEIAKSNDHNTLICIPGVFSWETIAPKLNKDAASFWKQFIIAHIFSIRKIFTLNKVYGDAFISRPYMDWTSSEKK